MEGLNFFIKDFGCKVNQYNSRIVRDNLSRLGYNYSSLEKAEVVIINTCSVTHRATGKGLKYCRRIKRKYPSKEVLAMGCSTRYVPEKFEKDNINILRQFLFIDNPNGNLDEFYSHTRGFINLQQGCHGGCKYCTVKDLKSPFYIKSAEDAKKEIEKLIKRHPEVVLTATNFKEYHPLLELAEKLKNLHKNFRWRFSSMHPGSLSQKLLKILKYDSKFCPHFHIPVQSGSNSVLKKMNRGYSISDVEKGLRMVRENFKVAGFSYDIITGFPGEKEEDHRKTKNFLKKFPPVKVHIFRYSDRPGTPAAEFDNKVPERIKKKRMDELRTLSLDLRKNIFKNSVGKIKEIVPEGPGKFGYTRDYMPVSLNTDTEKNGRFLKIEITDCKKNKLIGKTV
ncbi:MAG: radical SAM protein [Elusimicrobiota bacterium]